MARSRQTHLILPSRQNRRARRNLRGTMATVAMAIRPIHMILHPTRLATTAVVAGIMAAVAALVEAAADGRPVAVVVADHNRPCRPNLQSHPSHRSRMCRPSPSR